MEPYEEFYKKQFARLQGQAITTEPASTGPQRVSLIQFHGVAVLSPLLTVEKRQEMQQYRQKAIEVNEKRLNNKKKSLLNRVQEILDTVQVKTVSSCKPDTENETRDQSPHMKNLNGFAILPDALNIPVFCSQNGPAKFEKSVEDLISKKELKSTEKISSKECKDRVPPTQNKSPTANNAKFVSMESTDSSIPETSLRDLPPTTKDAPDPYVMSLQNLLKKSREYIEQSRRSMKSSSKGSSTESHSDKENTIKISDSVKEKTRLAHRSRSSSPLLVDKPTINKSNTLLQAALSQGQNSGTLPMFSKVDIPLRPETSSGADTESDEELRSGFMLEYESNMIKSLTGSYAKLPSPEPSLSPKMHRRRPRPLSAGNIVINHPVNAYDLSPKEKGKMMDLTHPETNEKTSLSEFVPKDVDRVIISSMKRHSFSESIDMSNSIRHSRSNLINSKMDHDYRADHSGTVTGAHCTPICKGVQCPSPCSAVIPEDCALGRHVDPSTVSHKPYIPLEVVKHNSPAELNKSYDVETPSPILMQSQSTNQASDTPIVSSGREQFTENTLDIEVKRRLDLDLESTQCEHSPVPSEEEKKWLHERQSRSGSLNAPKSEMLLNSTLEDNLKKKMLAFEEIRKKLEEQHAFQLSLLIAEQEREQERLQREFEEEGRRLRIKEVDLPDWISRSESSPSESHSVSAVGSLVAPSQHIYGSTVESSFSLWGSAESRAPKISASRPLSRAKTRWSQVYSPQMQRKFIKVTALAKGFLTRRLMQTEKLKHLKQTVKDTAEFIRTFHTEVQPSKGLVSAQDISLQERVFAQLRAALYEIHDIFFAMDAPEQMNILAHDRELRREKMIRQMEKIKSPRDRVTLSSATQKSLDRKKFTRAVEIGMSNRKPISKPKALDPRILQPSQGQNAPINKLLSRQGSICKKNPKKEAKCCDNLRRQHSLG
ncbi:centriolar coiled-coil protein of 110 kDa [Hyla sarda]|uniref:centriolar coiled-coil protein of 110 kDa n=1 Tax=Hyla sarda TaxID=327740 RepID=UPI0024C442AD|nr:centriolar coiled-coil protein of 110 kDa [Hyla sarda]XP_056392327.1 centriolar coiled-coil protein of 110 kDa [Hyla sarda]